LLPARGAATPPRLRGSIGMAVDHRRRNRSLGSLQGR